MAEPIDESLRAKLASFLGHDRIYPSMIPMKEGDDGMAEPVGILPAISYRLVNGFRPDTIDKGRRPYADDTFLLEVFSERESDCQAIRLALLDEFRGPPKHFDMSAVPGGYLKWNGPDSPKVRWAEATDPTNDAQFPSTDAHDVLRFVQLLITIQYHQ